MVSETIKWRTQDRKNFGRSARGVRRVWVTVSIKAYLSSGRGNPPIVLMVIIFHRCLRNGNTPQLPCEHRTNS